MKSPGAEPQGTYGRRRKFVNRGQARGLPQLSVAERREAVKNLTAEDYSTRKIADIVGVSHVTVADDVKNLTPLDAVAALADRLGVPKALGLTTKQWVQDRLGGYVQMSVADRHEAVRNLTADGYSARKIADFVGVSHETAAKDVRNLTPLDAVAALAADNQIRSTAKAIETRQAKEDERKADLARGRVAASRARPAASRRRG